MRTTTTPPTTRAVGALARSHVTRNPANQWLAAEFGRRRAYQERLEARAWAAQYVRGGLGPLDPTERDRAIQALLVVRFRADTRQAIALAVAYIQGWAEHHDTPPPQVWWSNAYQALPTPRPVQENR